MAPKVVRIASLGEKSQSPQQHHRVPETQDHPQQQQQQQQQPKELQQTQLSLGAPKVRMVKAMFIDR
jgi:hypothetical protein